MTVMHYFLLLYALVLLVWAWPPMRFLVSVYPLLLYFIWCGAARVGERAPILRGTRVLTVAALVVVFFYAGWALGGTTARAITLGTVCTTPPCVRWTEVEELFDFMREGTAPGAVIMTNIDPLVYLYTGHKAIRAFEPDPYALHYDLTDPERREPLGPPEKLISRLEASGARYVVMVPSESPNLRFLRRQIRKTMHLHPGLLERIPAGCAEQHCVYRVE